MNDQIFDRIYQDGRADLNNGIDLILNRVGCSITGAFNAMHRVQFAAPWSKRQRTTECA